MHNSRLTRKSSPKRRTGLKRSTTRIRSRSPRKAALDRGYTIGKSEHLIAHPLCQITIAELGLVEAEILAALESNGGEGSAKEQGPEGWWQEGFNYRGHFVPFASQLHHRNKRNGPRVADPRWFMSASVAMHNKVENYKDWARGRGYLLNISANPDGLEPGGRQALTTDELLARRAAEKAGEPPISF